MLARLRKLLFGISSDETTVTKRRFQVSDERVRQHIEKIGQTFVAGYHLAIADPRPVQLAAGLNEIEPACQGFAYEGAGMGLALLDILTPWPTKRLVNFLHGPGKPHSYMIQVGVGWALARLHRPVEAWFERLDPVVNRLVLDGYGFHEGFFDWPRYIEEQELPRRLSYPGGHLRDSARRGFDQGLGRSLWFVKGADADQISTTIAAFSPARRPDLWSGVGLACAYAGGVDRCVIETLVTRAGPNRPYLAQGAVFAAGARQRAGNPVPHNDLACQVICAMSQPEAAALFHQTGEALPAHGDVPAYEIWRQRIQAHFHPVPRRASPRGNLRQTHKVREVA